MRNFQHVILGTGQATGTLLGDLLPTGDSIAVIEGDRVGGTCVNTGCTPTKALVASAKVAHMVRRAPEYGIQPNGVEIDFDTVRARMNAIRDNTAMVSWISSAENVSLIEDWGRFEGPRVPILGILILFLILFLFGVRVAFFRIFGIDFLVRLVGIGLVVVFVSLVCRPKGEAFPVHE